MNYNESAAKEACRKVNQSGNPLAYYESEAYLTNYSLLSDYFTLNLKNKKLTYLFLLIVSGGSNLSFPY